MCCGGYHRRLLGVLWLAILRNEWTAGNDGRRTDHYFMSGLPQIARSSASYFFLLVRWLIRGGCVRSHGNKSTVMCAHFINGTCVDILMKERSQSSARRSRNSAVSDGVRNWHICSRFCVRCSNPAICFVVSPPSLQRTAWAQLKKELCPVS